MRNDKLNSINREAVPVKLKSQAASHFPAASVCGFAVDRWPCGKEALQNLSELASHGNSIPNRSVSFEGSRTNMDPLELVM